MLMSDRKKIKILHIGEYVQGGVATYLQTILGVDDDCFEEHLVLSKNKSSHEWNLPFEHIHYYDYKRGIIGALKAVLTIRKLIYQLQPDIIYCHSTWAGVIGRLSRILSWKQKSKVIYNAHGWAFLMQVNGLKKIVYAWVERLLSLTTDCIINVSKFEYNAAVYHGLNKQKMCVLYSGTELPSKDSSPVNYVMDKSKINLLFVGRFDYQKGVDYLIKIINTYEGDNIHLYLIGKNVISSNEIVELDDKKITYLGWIPHDKIDGYYRGCDAVIMPSRWEAFGLVAIEAMKYRKPVVISNRGALPELVKDGFNGYVFDMDDDNDLVNVFKKLEKDSLINMGKNGFNEYSRKYTSDNMRCEVKKIYLNLVG